MSSRGWLSSSLLSLFCAIHRRSSLRIITANDNERGSVDIVERGEATLVVKNVPAYVCQYCGDSLLPEEVSERLDAAMDAAVAAGGTTVRDYNPETTTV